MSYSKSNSFSSPYRSTPIKASSSSSKFELSKSMLQNNIGALMLCKGLSIPLAMQRFHCSLSLVLINDDDDDNDLNNETYDDKLKDQETTNCNSKNTCDTCSMMDSLRTIQSEIQSVISETHPNIFDQRTQNNHHNNNVSHMKQGLIWFHNKLLREVLSLSTSSTTSTSIGGSSRKLSISTDNHYLHHQHNGNTNTSTTTTTTNNNNNNSFNPQKQNNNENPEENDLFQYNNYHINDNIPLGIEYIHDPILCLQPNHNNDNQNKYYCEMNVIIAAGINLALCLWSSNNSSSSNNNDNSWLYCQNRIQMEKANNALKILEIVLNFINEQTKNDNNNRNENDESFGTCCSYCKVKNQNRNDLKHTSWADILKEEDHDHNERDEEDDEGDTKSTSSTKCPDPTLLIIIHNNIGVLYFILNKVKQAVYHFEQAREIVTKMNDIVRKEKRIDENVEMNDDSIDRRECFRNRSSSTSIIPPTRTQLLQSTKYKNRSSSYSYILPSTTKNVVNSNNKQMDHQSLLPSMEYLHLSTLLNLTRATIRLNGMLEHAKALSTELYDLIGIMTNCDSSLQGCCSSKSLFDYQNKHSSFSSSSSSSSCHHSNCKSAASSSSSSSISYQQQNHIKWLITVCTNYIPGLLQQRLEHYTQSIEYYNIMLSHTRKELGHDHLFVAMILEKKGHVLFDQRKCQTAMLSYLASLRIYEHQPIIPTLISTIDPSIVVASTSTAASVPTPASAPGLNDNNNGYLLEQSRLLYAIGRTLHDREEFADALNMYQKALSLLQRLGDSYTNSSNSNPQLAQRSSSSSNHRTILVESIQIMCNIGRILQIMGELESSLSVNLKIVDMATEMVGGGVGEGGGSQSMTSDSSTNPNNSTITESPTVLHPFVRNRLVVVGNVYVEMGKLDQAMKVFSQVARGSGEEGMDWMVGHLRPETEDVDTSAFAVRAAERLGELGAANNLSPHAAAA